MQFDAKADARPRWYLELGLVAVGYGIYASIRNDPYTAIQRERLVLVFGFKGSPQQCMAEADVAVHPDPLFIWTPESHKVGHPAEKRTIDGCAIQMKNADDSAHLRASCHFKVW